MSNNRISEIQTTQTEPGREQRIFTYKATKLVWWFFGILEALLAIRVILQLIGANSDSPIAGLIYAITDFFLKPFIGLTAAPTAGGIVLEISTIIAMVVYALIAWALERLIWVIFYRPRGPVVGVEQTMTSDPYTTKK